MLLAATYVRGSKWTNHQQGNDFIVEAGAYFEPDPKYYKDSGIKPRRAPAKGMEKYDVLKETVPAARKEGVALYCWLSDFDRREQAKEHPELYCIGLDGNPTETDWWCLNQPRAQRYAMAFYEDIARRYDVDGFFIDRIRWPSPICFCEACQHKMEEQGLEPKRLRRGHWGNCL